MYRNQCESFQDKFQKTPRLFLGSMQPDELHELKADNHTTVSLRAGKAGRIKLAYKRGYAVPQELKFCLET